ncbi:MAG: preprotein translocase subunit SecY, partial [Thermodesulfobacteriota bacterium]
MPEEPEARKFALSDFQKRFLYTIGLVLITRVLFLIPAPGIDLHPLWETTGEIGRGVSFLTLHRFSIIALSIMPYLSAYIIVEILSLFIPSLKSWRKDGYFGRTRLKRIALFTTFPFALLAGFGTAVGWENIRGAAGEMIALSPGWPFQIVIALTLTAGTFITVWIAELITMKGIGHGVSILLLAEFGENILSDSLRITPLFYERGAVGYFLILAAIVVALIALILLMEKSHKRISVEYHDGVEAFVPLKFTSAGIMPAYWGSLLIGLPISIFGFIDFERVQKTYYFLTIYFIVYAIVTIFFYYLFTALFYSPKKMAIFLKNKSAVIVSHSGENQETFIDRKLELMIPIAAIYLCLVIYVPKILSRVFYSSLDGIGLIIAVAIILDLMEELRLRKKGVNLVKIAELHDVPMAGLLKSLLEQ